MSSATFRHPCQTVLWNKFSDSIVCCSGPFLKEFACSTGEKLNEYSYEDKLDQKHREAAAYGQAVRFVAYSKDGSFMVTVNEDKTLCLWNVINSKIQLVKLIKVAKRCSALECSENGDIVYADKFGDVFRIEKNWLLENGIHPEEQAAAEQQAAEAAKSGKQKAIGTAEHSSVEKVNNFHPLLGHVSILTQLLICKDPKNPSRELIITSDKDEHIRVSRFPQSYVIEGFCLGHEDFVSRICLVDNDMLASGGGDNHVFLWDLSTYKCLDAFNIKAAFSNYLNMETSMALNVLLYVPPLHMLMVASEGNSGVVFIRIVDGRRLEYHSVLATPYPVISATLRESSNGLGIILALDNTKSSEQKNLSCLQYIDLRNFAAPFTLSEPPFLQAAVNELPEVEQVLCPLSQVRPLRKAHSKFFAPGETRATVGADTP
ncbi:tRNA (guanine-N7-)-methyltransferase subunit Trm82 [Schizosaccharomyces japonicus yFS275]|uniref:tRNA (Guanine-N7-)-methyltransferase subunit Trm82 n=1 Tax=Schizosaccharomyces japonicus (strain yFS275 / FY16936) TaxID=402676 RepID=B6K7X4_SCHJY|nr:tRNA (guanine-N7-)-methyltransferase subunit Trm82 [Schizosaccharomyces japonicus yFS275]EEB09628.1 tRNA (guanine-N7-)-methyltransferase subunit Trm82 [Schizosaccharomyces japonicus yFS275]